MVQAGEGKYGLCIVCINVYDILAVLRHASTCPAGRHQSEADLVSPLGSTDSCPEPETLLQRELSHQHFVDAVGWYGTITGLCLT